MNDADANTDPPDPDRYARLERVARVLAEIKAERIRLESDTPEIRLEKPSHRDIDV